MNSKDVRPFSPPIPRLYSDSGRRIAFSNEALEVSEDRREEYGVFCSRLVVCESMARAQRTVLLMSVQFPGPASDWVRVVPWQQIRLEPVWIGPRKRAGAQSKELARQLAALTAGSGGADALRALLVDCRAMQQLDGARIVESLSARAHAEQDAGDDLRGAVVIFCGDPGQRVLDLGGLESRLACAMVLRDPCFAEALRRLGGARGPIDRLRSTMQGMGLRLLVEPGALEVLAEQIWSHPLGVLSAESCVHELGLRVFRAMEIKPGNLVRVYPDGPRVGLAITTEEARS